MGQIRRRTILLGSAGAVAAAGVGLVVAGPEVVPLPGPVRRRLADQGNPGVIPDAAEGVVRLDRRDSAARGRTVGFFTAVPAGHGDGAGLPVCLVLHGASATTADFRRFGLPRFTAATQAGVPPFVLAGADGGRSRWEGDGAGDDPQRMLAEEILPWCAERGYDVTRVAAYGWSMGGFGVLRAATARPGTLRAAAALSPAVSNGDAVFRAADRLDGRRTALWCGRSDSLYPAVLALARRIPGGLAIAAWGEGAHTRGYWDRVTPDLLRFVGAALADPT